MATTREDLIREALADMQTSDDSTNDGPTRMATVVQPLAHPVLRSVDPKKVAVFLREWTRYGREVTEKQKEYPNLTKASFKVAIDDGLLENMHFMGALDEFAKDVEYENLTDAIIEKYIRSIVAQGCDEDLDPSLIENALNGIRVDMSIDDPKARMLQYFSDFFQRLEGVGYGDFKTKKPKKTVKLLHQYLYPPLLKTSMAQKLEYHEDLEKDVKKYIKFTCTEAVSLERQHKLQAKHTDYMSKRSKSSGKKPHSTEKSTEHSGSGKQKSGKRELPVCLHPTHRDKGIRHLLRDCDIATEAEKKQLFKDFKEKKGKSSKKVVSVETDVPEEKSTAVEAIFAGKQRRLICADGGSDINLMSPSLYAALTSSGAEMKVVSFNRERHFSLAVATKDQKPLFFTCNKMVTMNIELLIRHGKTLLIRNLPWYVSVEEMSEPLLGRPTMDALGLDTKEMLAAACDRFHGTVDADEILDGEASADALVARIRTEGVFYSDKAIAENSFDGEEDWLDIGLDKEEDVQLALQTMVENAKNNGLDERNLTRMRDMLRTYRDVFRLRLGPDGPAKVEPMRISLKEGSKPFLAKARRYPADQRVWMNRYIAQLQRFGMVTPNPNATWAAAPLVVPKPPPALFRLTFDYRPINTATQKVSCPMPHIESELSDLRGSTSFASIDFPSSYWQLPMHRASQHLLSFITPDLIMQPTRTTQGPCNSPANFQSRVLPCFKELKEKYSIDPLKAWLDDFLLHGKDATELMDKVEIFLRVCKERNLKISARKCQLFQTRVRWCGRVVDKDGVQFDPTRLSGLQRTSLPRNAAELCEFVYCLQWVALSVPDFAERVQPLRDMLECAYTKAKSRKKRAIQRYYLKDLGWATKHENAFLDLQAQIREMTKLSHRDPDMEICIFTDASEVLWAGVVTQCEADELDKPHEEQHHQPLAFLSAAFNDTQRNWTTCEKEAFAIYEVFRRLDYMLLPEENARVMTDHRNLLFIYNPRAIQPRLNDTIVGKVQRWALRMSRFAYTIEHIPGEKNVMADIMTRWYSGYRGKPSTIKRVAHLLEQRDIIPTATDDHTTWPTDETLIHSQSDHSTEAPRDAQISEDGLVRLEGKVWIPEEDSNLQLKLLVCAHCGDAGHRGKESTASALIEFCKWKSMEEDCDIFVKNCIHCLVAKGNHRIPRPISLTLHATKPNEVVHFDFVYMGNGVDGFQYILVISDDLSSYKWFVPCTHADSDSASAALARWIRTFTAMRYWVSDQGAHFKNEVMKLLADKFRIRHEFTVAYSPWVNGTVESVMRHMRAAFKALTSEMKLAPHDWPLLVGSVTSALNDAPLPRLGKKDDGTFRCPLEVFTGLKPVRAQLMRTERHESLEQERSIESTRAIQLMSIDKLQAELDIMHKSVNKLVEKNRIKHIRHHNKQTNIVAPNFSVGDFVLVRRAQDRGHKMSFRWVGPRRVSQVVSSLVYDVTDLQAGKCERVHAARLMLYRANIDGTDVSEELLKHAECSEAKYEVVDKLIDIGEADDGLFIQVQWEGLPDSCDWTWQEVNTIHEDIPEKLDAFLHSTGKKKLAKKALQLLKQN